MKDNFCFKNVRFKVSVVLECYWLESDDKLRVQGQPRF